MWRQVKMFLLGFGIVAIVAIMAIHSNTGGAAGGGAATSGQVAPPPPGNLSSIQGAPVQVLQTGGGSPAGPTGPPVPQPGPVVGHPTLAPVPVPPAVTQPTTAIPKSAPAPTPKVANWSTA